MRSLALTLAVILLSGCQQPDAQAPKSQSQVETVNVEEPWGYSRPDNYYDIDGWRKSPIETVTPVVGKDTLVLTEHTVGADEDTRYVQVTLTNNGSEIALVLPITPWYYQFQAKLVADGSVEALVPLPPVDPPLANEGTIVRLYPRNSISAVFGLKKSWRRKNATYRVVGYGNMQVTLNGKSTIVPFDVKSIWSPGK